jgi:hypothetical protein
MPGRTQTHREDVIMACLDFRSKRYAINIGVRLSEQGASRLQQYCRATGLRPPEVIRSLVNTLPDMEAKTGQEPTDAVHVE